MKNFAALCNFKKGLQVIETQWVNFSTHSVLYFRVVFFYTYMYIYLFFFYIYFKFSFALLLFKVMPNIFLALTLLKFAQNFRI